MSDFSEQLPEQPEASPITEVTPPAEAQQPLPPPPPRKRRLAHPIVLLAVLALGAFLRLYVYESDIVQGSSMLPGLRSGDYLLICKASCTGKPKRFDIVTFASPVEDKEILVKRLIGLPAEWVMVWNGRVYVNGRELKDGFAQGGDSYYSAPVWVPPGYMYVMGDNRDNSQDSREWGPVPMSSLRGKAVATFFPLNRAKMFRWRDEHETETM